jgi:hypothetical protein
MEAHASPAAVQNRRVAIESMSKSDLLRFPVLPLSSMIDPLAYLSYH